VLATDVSNAGNYTTRLLTLIVTPVGITSSFTLPTGNASTFYSYQLQATGGSGAYIWTVAPGNYLPAGLTLTSGGLLSGVPTVSGRFQFRVNVTDTLGNPQWAYLNLSLYPIGQYPPITIQNGPNFGTFSIGEVQFSLTAQGGSGQYTWSVVSGALPPGLSVRPDGPPWFPSNASGGVIGIATTPGTYTFTLRVTDSNNTTADLAATMTITPFTLKEWNLPDAFLGNSYSYTLTPLNAPGGVSWSSNFGMPPGLSLHPATGVISGTPVTAGFYNISVQATSGGVTIGRNINVGVYAIRLSTSTPLPGGVEGELFNATLGQSYSATITASGGSGTYTFSSNSLPNGLFLNQTSGAITGTYNAGPGRWTFTVTATDTAMVSSSRSFTIHAAATPAVLPSINVGDRLADCTLGVGCNRGVFANNGIVAPFSWSVSGLPAGMSMRPSIFTPGEIDIWGTPTELGDFQITVTITDATGAQGTNVFPLHVSELELTTFLTGAAYATPYSQKLRIIGGTPGYAASMVNVSPSNRLPVGVSLDGATQTVSGTPIETGSFNADVVFTDNASPTPHTLDIRTFMFVPGPGTSTIQISSNSDLGHVAAGSTLNMPVFACCLPSVTWSVVGGTPPAGLTITPQSGGNGQMTSSALSAGIYTFVLKVQNASDPNNFAVRQFTLAVTPVTFPSGFPFTLPFGNVGAAYSQQLPALSGATLPLTWSLVPYSSLPPGLSLNSSGLLSGTPTVSGQFQLLVNVVDAAGYLRSATLTLAVYPPGEAPPLVFSLSSTFNAGLGVFTQSISQTNVSGGIGPYHFALAPGAPVIAGLRVQDGPPLPTTFASGTPAGILAVFETAGTYTTTIRVTDSAVPAHFADKQVTFNVSPLLFQSPTLLPKATVNSPYSLTLSAFGGTGNLTWSATNLPAGMTIVSSTGELHGTPTAAGTFFPTITISDQGGHQSSTGVTLAINAFEITTGGSSLPIATQNQAYSTQLAQSGCSGTCTWSVVGTPPSGMTLSGSGLLSGTPTSTFNGSLNVQLTNGTSTVTKLFALVVTPAGAQAVSIINPSAIGPTTIGGSTLTSLTAAGGTRPYVWSIDSGTLPPGIGLTSDGSAVSSSSTAGFGLLYGRAAQTGVYTFTLRVTDANNESATRTYTWIVSALNFQYTSLPLGGTTLTRGTPYTQPLLVIGGTSEYAWSATPPAGLSLDSSGAVSGTPADSGSFNVPVTVSDTGGRTLTNNISFNIASGSGPVLNFGASSNQGPFVLGQNTNISLNPSGGTAPYTVTALTVLPPGFALLSGSAILSNGTPGTSYFLAGTPYVGGTFVVTLQLQDSVGNVRQRTFTVTVSPIAILTNIGLLQNSSLPDGSVNAPYSQQLVAIAAGSVVWTVAPNSALPAGLTLSSAGLLSGTPTTAATYTFQLNVRDVATGIVLNPANYTLKISPMAIQSAAVLPIATSLEPYSYTFGISGAPGPVSFTATGLPSGLSLSPAGVLSGAPTGGGSTFQITVTATSNGQSITRRVSLYVRPTNVFPASLPLAQTTLPDATVGQVYTFTLNPTGGLSPYTWSVAPGSSLPPGLSFVTGAQLPPNVFPGFTMIGGQPATPGQYTFDLIVTDGQPMETRRTFTLKVSSLNILSGNPRTVTAGQAYSQQLTAVGGTPPYTFSIAPRPTVPTQPMLPDGITFSPTGLFSGTTALTGTYNSTVTVQDSAGNTFSRNYSLFAVNGFGLSVNGGNPGDASVGAGIRQALLTNGGSTYAWTVAAGSLPSGVVLTADPENPSSWMITGQPGVPGVYTYTLRATDTANAANAADRTFTFNVSPMQIVSPPTTILTSDLPPAHVGVPYSAAIKVAGGTPPYSFAVSPATPLPIGLTLSTGGILSGTPAQNGGGSFTVVVTDGAGRTLNSFALPLFVNPAGLPPALTTSTAEMDNASVGVPYRFALNFQRSGVGPFTWTVAPGSTLPPGLAILSGNGVVPDYLAGAATTPGHYEFTLVVADSSGQTAKTPTLNLDVSPLALTPNEIPRGQVGVPYSVSLVPSGGTGPYTFSALPDWDMPPGLSLTGATLSGTPAFAGSWRIVLRVIDSASPANELYELLQITIDNALGEAPAIAIGQRSIQITYVQGSPAPSPSAVSVTTTSGALPFNVAIEGLPGATLSAATGTTPATVSLDVHPSSLAAGTYSGVLAVKAASAANIGDAIPVLVTVLTPPPCGYSLTPASASALAAGGTGNFALDTGAACAWTVSSPTPWITVTSPASGTGATTVQYTVAANGGVAQRSGTIDAGGQTFSVTQFGSSCSFAIGPQGLSAPAGGGTVPVDIAASDASCAWTASGLSVSPASGTGSATVDVTIPANTLPGSRTLTASIAGQTFTVNQGGIECAVTLSPLSADSSDAGGAGSFAVSTAAACGYSTTSSPNWVTIQSGGSGTGPGTLLFAVAPNSATTPRIGSIVVGGQSFSISQAAAACSVTLDTSALGGPFGAGSGSVSIGVSANGANCAWTASSPVNWASVAPNGASGNGTVVIAVAANPAVGGRSATLSIAGQSVTISQGGQACSYSLQSSTGTAPASGGSGTVGVVTAPSCAWTATSNDSGWLSASPGGSAGAVDVTFTAAVNPDPLPRIGTLTIAGKTFTVTQAAAACTYTLPVTGATIAGEGAPVQTFSLSGAAACSPAPVSYASWITIDQTAYTGGTGMVTYTALPNPLSSPRSGVIQIADQTFTVTQTVAQSACRYSLHAYGALFNRGGGGGDVFGSATDTSCNPGPTIGTDQPSFIFLGPLQGPTLDVFTQPFSVAPFNTPLVAVTRRGRITFGGQIFVVKQVSW
jgi:large repetitive protein